MCVNRVGSAALVKFNLNPNGNFARCKVPLIVCNFYDKMPPSESLRSSSVKTTGYHCRRRLQNRFEECGRYESKPADRSVLSVLSFNDNTRKALRNGAERLSKTLNTVRTTIGSLTQVIHVNNSRGIYCFDVLEIPYFYKTSTDSRGRSDDTRMCYSSYVFKANFRQNSNEIV